MASQVGVRQSARTFELQRRKFALMAAEHVRALGERIRLRREELGMTQDEVARQMSGTVDGQRISKWERGENRPRDESLEDLARVLKTTALELLAPEPKPTPDLSLVSGQEAALTGELAGVLQDIKDQLVEQNRVLAEIKVEQAELRGLIDGTAELRRLAQEIVTGRQEAEPDPEPVLPPPAAAKKSRAKAQRTR